MCRDCLEKKCPDRGSTCLEAGSYLLNYQGCAVCKALGLLQEVERERHEDENEETISFKHACAKCGHIVATHQYTFNHDDEFQEYTMNCMLCGHGEHTQSILPDDPRGQEMY